MEKLKKDNTSFFIVLIAFIFNIIVFAPIEMYFTNQKEFWFSILDILPIIGLYVIAFLLIGFIIFLICRGKARNIAKNILFSLFFGLYIQGNFLNFGYGFFDAEGPKWETMIVKGIINTIIWLAIFIIPFVFKKIKKDELFNKISSCVALLVIGMQISTLGVLLIMSKNNEEKEMRYGLNNSNIFNFSKEENIVIMMADTFEGTYMNDILEKNPEYKEKLKDFIYFDNCSTTCFYTFSSLPIMLTGEEVQLGKNLKENLEEGFGKTNIYSTLKENGYSTELYLEKMLTVENNQADNLDAELGRISTKFSTKTQVGKYLYKAVLFRYMPHFLKSNFMVNSYDFNKIKSSDKSLLYKYGIYYLDDVIFNHTMQEDGMETKNNKKVFKFYQLNAMHKPYDTTPDLEYNKEESYLSLPEEERRYNEGIAALNMLINYVNNLKKAGIYDKTTIIFLADHGNENRFYTTLLIKKKDANQEFTINSAPVSTLEDLKPTILNIATNSKNYGKDFFDYKEGEPRTRRAIEYLYKTKLGIEEGYKPIKRKIYEITDHVKNKELIKMVKEENE